MLTEEKKRYIRRALINGASVSEVATEMQVSRSTVKRIKKKLPAQIEKVAAVVGDMEIDTSERLTKQEAKYLQGLQGVQQLYEDPVEGWCYHMKQGDQRARTSGRWWSAIVYPESAPDNWIGRIRSTGARISISPLHDRDKWDHDSPEMLVESTGEIIPKGARYKAGDRKKAHWHVIIVFDRSASYQDANALIRSCTNGPYIQKCRSLRLAYEYFLHINAPEKYQGYDKSEIQSYNDFHLEPNKYETGMMQCEMMRMIEEHDITEVRDFVELLKDQPEYMTVFCGKPGAFTSYISSRWKAVHPDRVQRVMLVKEREEYADQ